MSATFSVKYSLFQFTHPGGVRLIKELNGRHLLCFNSRTREGCDSSTLPSWMVSGVSIHAPGRGATDNVKEGEYTLYVFQFTHPGGVRRYGAKLRIMGRINKRNLRLEVLL